MNKCSNFVENKSEVFKRVQYKRFYIDYYQRFDLLIKNGISEWEVAKYLPSLPRHLIDLTCGATTRAGTYCKLKGIYANSRCKLHGGLSTGPRTIEGKAKSSKNGLKPKNNKRTP